MALISKWQHPPASPLMLLGEVLWRKQKLHFTIIDLCS